MATICPFKDLNCKECKYHRFDIEDDRWACFINEKYSCPGDDACWRALGKIKSLEDLDKLINSFPEITGKWDYWTENGTVMVRNLWVDDVDCEEEVDIRELYQFRR